MPNQVNTGGYGKSIIIDHLDGTTTRYAHNVLNFVAVGTMVHEGRVIGLLGQTGNAAGQPLSEAHVHFEIRNRGALVNPATFLNSPCPVNAPPPPRP